MQYAAGAFWFLETQTQYVLLFNDDEKKVAVPVHNEIARPKQGVKCKDGTERKGNEN